MSDPAPRSGDMAARAEAADAFDDGEGPAGGGPAAPRAESLAKTANVSRFVGYLSLFGLVLILGAFAWLVWQNRIRLEDEAMAEVRAAAFALADHAARILEVSDIALRGAATAVEGESWDEIARSEALHRRLQATRSALPYIEDVWLNDEKGLLRATSLVLPAPFSDASDRAAFKAQTRPNDELFVGERIVGRLTQRPTFLLAKRLSWPDGSFKGMVSVTADLGYFNDFWARTRLPKEARVTLFRGGLDILAQHPPPPREGGFAPLATSALRDQIAAHPGGGAFETEGEDGRIEAFDRVGELPVYLGVSVPRESIEQVWLDSVQRYGAFASAALVTLGLLSLLAFRQGRRDAAIAGELGRAYRELEEVNTGLEAAVAEQTADLREANEELQRFAYIVSHDLRSPLVNIMGFTSELEALRDDFFKRLEELRGDGDRRRDDELAQDVDEALGFIKAAIGKMDRLINAILRLSREGRREFHPERVDMDALLAGIKASVAHQVEAAGATIEVGRLPGLQSDRVALEQIFSNLVDNALKYGRPGEPGRVEVRGRAELGSVLYEVRDNGRGIDARDRERVFDLFRRSGQQDKPGEGIGLAHVRALVRRLGGTITLTSELGQGSTFTVRLPRLWVGERKAR